MFAKYTSYVTNLCMVVPDMITGGNQVMTSVPVMMMMVVVDLVFILRPPWPLPAWFSAAMRRA